MTNQTCQQVFTAAKAQRIASRPFDRISAYKVRECRNRLQHERDVAASIDAYRKGGPGYYRPQLVGCTSEDKTRRLKQVPRNVARQLGENLIPAIEALVVEGVPALDVRSFVVSIAPRVKQLIHDCEIVRTTGGLHSMCEPTRLGASAVLCDEAVYIADLAVEFCRLHGVL